MTQDLTLDQVLALAVPVDEFAEWDLDLSPKVEPPPVAPAIPNQNVIVKFKENTEITVELDADKLTWQDMKLLRAAQANPDQEQAETLVFDMLFKLTGQDMTLMPMRVMNAVMAQLGALSTEMSDPNA